MIAQDQTAAEIAKAKYQARFHHDPSSLKLIGFDQIWSSTARGFGQIGGAALTVAPVQVVDCQEVLYFFVSGQYAYSAVRSEMSPDQWAAVLETVRTEKIHGQYGCEKLGCTIE